MTTAGGALLCTDAFHAEYGSRLREVAPGLGVVAMDQTNSVAAGDLERITIAFLSKDAWPERTEPFLAVMENTPNLEWFHVMAAGVDHPIFDSYRARGIHVTRSAGASANAMAETVFTYLLALAHDLRSAVESYADRAWEWGPWPELEGRRIAVLGYGAVGRRVLHLASAFDMVPTAVRRSVRGDEVCPTRTLAELGDVVAESDVVVVALPLTDDTRGIVSREVIARMRPDTLFVNVARGALVDQGALTDALAGGRLGGAGLDVFETEPLPAADPLWDLPNVIITPHNSGSSHGSPRRVVDIFFANLELYLSGSLV